MLLIGVHRMSNQMQGHHLFAFTMLLIGGAFAMGIRAELLQPGLQLMEPSRYN
jgi:heme/copper-type cytochrome/quinol oxidase subunit 1